MDRGGGGGLLDGARTKEIRRKVESLFDLLLFCWKDYFKLWVCTAHCAGCADNLKTWWSPECGQAPESGYFSFVKKWFIIAMKMKIDKDEDNIDSPPEAREPGTEFSA